MQTSPEAERPATECVLVTGQTRTTRDTGYLTMPGAGIGHAGVAVSGARYRATERFPLR